MIKEYTDFVIAHCRGYVDLNYCVIALNEEAGEVAGWYKKAILRGNLKGLSDEDLLGECGDVLFYLTALANFKGWTLKDIMEFNMNKLIDRSSAQYDKLPKVNN